jgi:hypothetical protein
MIATHFFSTDQSYRYWRVVISDEGNAWGYVELGVAWIGKSLDVQAAQNGFKFNLVDRSKSVTTDFGHTYTDEYPITSTLNFQYQYLDYEDIQTIENAFRENGNRKPVLVVIDPDAAVFDQNHFTIYGYFKSDFGLSHVRYDILNSDGIAIVEAS